MIKNRWLLGIVPVLAVVLVMALGACGSGNGTVTVTNIPSKFNGKYIVLYASTTEDNLDLMGMKGPAEEIYTYYSAQISGGKASMPMWIMPQWPDTESKVYRGNHTVEMEMVIHEENVFMDNGNDLAWLFYESVILKNGSAKVSYKDADEVEEE